MPVPQEFRCQPIDPAEVAVKLVDLALGPPSGRVDDIGGPQVSTWAEMVRQYLAITKRKRVVLEIWMPRMRGIREGCLLVNGDSEGASSPDGKTTWEEFLARKLA